MAREPEARPRSSPRSTSSPPARRRATGRRPASPARGRGKVIARCRVRAADPVAFLFFTPFLWSVSTSLKTHQESVAGFDLIPDDPTLDAYRDVLPTSTSPATRPTAPSSRSRSRSRTSLLASIGGYAFARLRFPGREALFMLVLATLMIPDQLRLVPLFQMLTTGAWSRPTRVHPDQARRGDEPVPDAPVLPDHPERLRGGGEARRRRLLQDVLEGDAAARRAGARRDHDPRVPGHLERVLLAADHPPGRVEVHAHDRDLELRRHLQHAVAAS